VYVHRKLRSVEALRFRSVRIATSLLALLLSASKLSEKPSAPEIKDELPGIAATVVAYALAGNLDIDITTEALGT